MTRTERASHPRALVKDRSESKSGLDKRIQKNGAGAHGWGSLADEVEHEMAAELDELADSDTEPVAPSAAKAPGIVRRPSELTEEEKEAARKVRQQALKDGHVDLGSIARTSAAVAHSPPKAGLQAPLTDAPTTSTLPQVQ